MLERYCRLREGWPRKFRLNFGRISKTLASPFFMAPTKPSAYTMKREGETMC